MLPERTVHFVRREQRLRNHVHIMRRIALALDALRDTEGVVGVRPCDIAVKGGSLTPLRPAGRSREDRRRGEKEQDGAEGEAAKGMVVHKSASFRAALESDGDQKLVSVTNNQRQFSRSEERRVGKE